MVETSKVEGFVFPFEKLEVWQLAVDLADFVLNLLESFLTNKHLRLISQMEAAVSGIAQNIAEGKGRQYKKEFIQFLYIARGSLFEVVTLLIIFNNLGWFKTQSFVELQYMALEITKMLNSLIKSMK